MKDWTGNKKTTFVSLGASNHSLKERQVNDYYATDPRAIELLLEVETFNSVWECACGEGHLAKILNERGLLGRASDLIDRGYGESGVDFLLEDKWDGDIITNPPYKYAQRFVETALKIIPDGNKVAMFLKLSFLEGQARKKIFLKYPPRCVYVFSGRITCAMNGDFKKYNASAICYAWFVWQKGFVGDPIIKWI